MTIRLLIVDDNKQVRQDLRTLLALSKDIEIVGEAANGLEAVDLVELLKPDVVLLDLEMPLMDGYEAAQQIKALAPSLRIITLTVHDYGTAREKALQAGVDSFIVKGIPVEKLIQEILDQEIN